MERKEKEENVFPKKVFLEAFFYAPKKKAINRKKKLNLIQALPSTDPRSLPDFPPRSPNCFCFSTFHGHFIRSTQSVVLINVCLNFGDPV